MENMTIKATPVLLKEPEYAVNEGHYKNKSEAIFEDVNLIVRKNKLKKVRERIMKSREGTESMPSLTELVVKSHEEEDER